MLRPPPRAPGGAALAPAPAPNAVAPVFLSTPRCPACGREPAIVFHVVQSAGKQRRIPAGLSGVLPEGAGPFVAGRPGPAGNG